MIELTIRNVPPQIKLKTVRHIVNFCDKELLSRRLSKNIKLLLRFSEDSIDVPKGCDGNCFTTDYDGPQRDFEIIIRSSLERGAIIKAIPHEMKHVQQYAEGRLYPYERSEHARWGRRVYKWDPSSPKYVCTPWELEAVKAEQELVAKMYKEHFKNV